MSTYVGPFCRHSIHSLLLGSVISSLRALRLFSSFFLTVEEDITESLCGSLRIFPYTIGCTVGGAQYCRKLIPSVNLSGHRVQFINARLVSFKSGCCL